MNMCEKGIDCLQCNSRGMCSSYANFKYQQGYNDAIELIKEELIKDKRIGRSSLYAISEIINKCELSN